MSSLLLDMYFTPDEVRIIRSALSRTITEFHGNPTMQDIVDEAVQVYKQIQKISDEKWPGWCNPNQKLRAILSQ